MLPLTQLEVLVVDCQATAAAPRGHLLEIGWARARGTITDAQTRLITLAGGARIPPAVVRITGISESMMRCGVDARVAWGELLAQAARLEEQPAPTIIHFARFEQPFLRSLAGGNLPLDVICTHDVARRLLPDLPRRTLRALTGYFGRAVGSLRRSADHVQATAFVWQALVRLLGEEGVSTWSALHEWLAAPVDATRRRRRVWPMPRDVRLSLPDVPGVYRMLRTSGDVLYVGKASSLRQRVNSHFRQQHGVPERMLEMLSQARAISFDITPSALEAALLECDEIKRHRPPYNVALVEQGRAVWFTPPDLSVRSPRPSSRRSLGPFSSAETLDEFAALARASRAALGSERWDPAEATFNAGYSRLCSLHPELSGIGAAAPMKLLRLGTRLWRDGRRDRDADTETGPDRSAVAWTPELVQLSLEWLVLRTALGCRRARWLTRLVEASVVWREPGVRRARLIVIENGEITTCAIDPDAPPPIPPHHRRSVADRHEAFTIARFDRLRVLTTELKRLVADGAQVAVRFGEAPALAGGRLASALWWV